MALYTFCHLATSKTKTNRKQLHAPQGTILVTSYDNVFCLIYKAKISQLQ